MRLRLPARKPKWEVVGRYNNTARAPHQPGELALRSLHRNRGAAAAELRRLVWLTDVDIEAVRLR